MTSDNRLKLEHLEYLYLDELEDLLKCDITDEERHFIESKIQRIYYEYEDMDFE